MKNVQIPQPPVPQRICVSKTWTLGIAENQWKSSKRKNWFFNCRRHTRERVNGKSDTGVNNENNPETLENTLLDKSSSKKLH